MEDSVLRETAHAFAVTRTHAAQIPQDVARRATPRGASFEPSGLGCDEVPTGVATRDHWLHFKVPAGLMPDPQFDGRPAKLEVHRVSPVYANGKCPWVSNRAAVLIHGRTVTGPVAFDLRDPATDGGELSVQEALARAGIDTFAPSLLGYGRSTRFDEGLNDPGNASLRPYIADGTCPYPEGCDRTVIPFPLDQQGTLLAVNPLAGERRAHSSHFRFARTDVWVRDIRQVIDHAIARAEPTDGKVALLGYSPGGQRVGRTLYTARADPALTAKVSRVVFLSSLFGGPTEEPATVTAPTFPLTLNADPGRGGFAMTSTARDEACSGHVIEGTPEQLWAQTMKLDTLGRRWGGHDPAHPTGLNRSPTFSGCGWNAAVAGQLTTPTLVIQGLEDVGVPGGPATAPAIFNALPASMTNRVLVQVECASHALPWEGCAGTRCEPASGTPYGGAPRRTVGRSPCHAQGSASRVDRERDLQRCNERPIRRRRKRRGQHGSVKSLQSAAVTSTSAAGRASPGTPETSCSRRHAVVRAGAELVALRDGASATTQYVRTSERDH